MAMYKDLFMKHMDDEGIKYENLEKEGVAIRYSADNKDAIRVVALFDEDGDGMVAMYAWSIAKFPEEKAALAYKICNDINAQYRWIKFYLDPDGEIAAQVDAYVYPDSCGEQCVSLVNRIVGVVDETYPTFMKALWG